MSSGSINLGLLVLSLAVCSGCQGHRETDVVGTWKSDRGYIYTLESSKTLRVATPKGRTELGEWSLSGKDVTILLKTVDGRSITDLKTSLHKRMATLSPRLRAGLDLLGKPEVFTLDGSNRAMTKRDTAGRTVTLTRV